MHKCYGVRVEFVVDAFECKRWVGEQGAFRDVCGAQFRVRMLPMWGRDTLPAVLAVSLGPVYSSRGTREDLVLSVVCSLSKPLDSAIPKPNSGVRQIEGAVTKNVRAQYSRLLLSSFLLLGLHPR